MKGSTKNTISWWFFDILKWNFLNCLILHVSCSVEKKICSIQFSLKTRALNFRGVFLRHPVYYNFDWVANDFLSCVVWHFVAKKGHFISSWKSCGSEAMAKDEKVPKDSVEGCTSCKNNVCIKSYDLTGIITNFLILGQRLRWRICMCCVRNYFRYDTTCCVWKFRGIWKRWIFIVLDKFQMEHDIWFASDIVILQWHIHICQSTFCKIYFKGTLMQIWESPYMYVLM